MTDLLNSVAIYKQLDLPESESDNSNVNDILINNNFSQHSTPNAISKCNSNSNKHIKHKKIKYNNDNDNTKTNIEYNDTIDEYVETTKKKNNTSLKPNNNNNNNNNKRRTSNTSSQKRPIPSSLKKKPFTTKSTSLKKAKPKSTKASHNSLLSSRSATNNINNPSSSTTKHSQSKKTNLSITNQHNIKQQTINTLKAKSNSVSKSTLSSSYQSKNTKTYEQQQQHVQPKQSNSSLNKSKQLSQKEFLISNATTIENPTTDNNEQGITQLILSKDESNETSFMNNTQRVVPLRKNTRKDSYKHSIMVVQEKLLRKEEEKGENSKISFNDTEFQIRKKRSTLGEFKDIDEHEVKPQPKLKKSSKKFVTHKPSNKAVVVKNENVTANTEDVVVVVDGVDDQKEFEFNNSKHSIIIEENAEHGSTDKKREVNEMDDKFMKLFNEVKGKLLHEKEQFNEQRKCRLTKSNSTPLYNANINDLLFNSTTNDELTHKKQFIVDILKQNTNTAKHTNAHKDINENDVKRSINLKHKFKLLKRITDKTINNSINVNNNSNSNSNTKSMLLKYKHNVSNDVLLSETNDKDSQYKTFTELKLKAMGTKLILNDLLINKHFEFCDVGNDETNNIQRRTKEKYIKYINKSTKAQNYQYKGLNMNKLLLHSSLLSFKRDDPQMKVFPPNAMDKSKFNYFIE